MKRGAAIRLTGGFGTASLEHPMADDGAAPWERAAPECVDREVVLLKRRLDLKRFKLPLMPATVSSALQLTRDPKSFFVGLSGLIETDPPLTAQLLRLANSPLFGGMRPVGGLQSALVRVGLDGIRELLIMAAAARIFVVPGNRRLTERLQRRAVAVGLCANNLAFRCNLPKDEAFTAGVLHDVGQVVAWQLIKDCRADLGPRFDDVHEQKRLADAAHQDIGARLGREWRLPAETIAALGFHHAPHRAGANGRLAWLVAASNAIVDFMGVHVEDDSPEPWRRPALERLGMGRLEVVDIARVVAHRLGLDPS